MKPEDMNMVIKLINVHVNNEEVQARLVRAAATFKEEVFVNMARREKLPDDVISQIVNLLYS